MESFIGYISELDDEVLRAVKDYMDKHRLAVKLGGEYVGQNDQVQVDAIELACDLANIYKKHCEKKETN